MHYLWSVLNCYDKCCLDKCCLVITFFKIGPQMKFQYWPKSKLVWPLEYQGGIFREAPKNLQNISWNINVFVDTKQTRMYEARQNKTKNVLKLKFSPEFQRKDWIKWKDIFLLLKFISCQRKNFLLTRIALLSHTSIVTSK